MSDAPEPPLVRPPDASWPAPDLSPRHVETRPASERPPRPIDAGPAPDLSLRPIGSQLSHAVPPGFVTAMRVPNGATLTTFSIFRYPRGSWLWALRQMGSARRPLAATPGLGFHHLLGSGAGLGFSRVPDFSRYALLATWSSEQAADDFFAVSPVIESFRRRASEVWTVKLLARRSRGSWKRQTPFTPTTDDLPPGLPTVVITRASLRLRAMLRFWGRVPAIERDLVAAPGMRLALGVGELPWVRPVTFSVWDDEAALERFANAGSHHAAARAAHARGWFRENLFARFTAIATQGQIAGHDPCGLSPVPRDMSLGPAPMNTSLTVS